MITALVLHLAVAQLYPFNRAREANRLHGAREANNYAFLEAFPASGAGTTTACSTIAPTGARGEVATVVRASVGECPGNDGQSYTQLAINVARVSSGVVGDTWLGIWSEPQSVNYLSRSRDLSHADWVKTNMTCARTANGMRNGDANGASTCTATAINGQVMYTVVRASSKKNGSLHIKRRTGTGVVSVTIDDGATWYPITSSLSNTLWKRVVTSDTPGCAGGLCIVVPGMTVTMANQGLGIRLGTSADAVDVDFAQMEDGDRAFTPCEATTSTCIRSQETISFTHPAAVLGSMSALVQNQVRYADNKSTTGYTYLWDTNGSHRATVTTVAATEGSLNCGVVNPGATSVSNQMWPPSISGAFVPIECIYGASAFGEKTYGTAAASGAAAIPTSSSTLYLGSALADNTQPGGVIKGVRLGLSTTEARWLGGTSGLPAVIWLGDSITRGDTSSPDRPPTVLARDYNRAAYNFGRGGATVGNCLTDWRTIRAGPTRPASLVVLCGVNSLVAGDSAATIFASLQLIFDEARADGVNVVPVTILPWAAFGTAPADTTTTDSLNALITGYCTTNSITCVDAFTPMATGYNLAAIYDSGDGLHPNAAGSIFLAGLVEAALP